MITPKLIPSAFESGKAENNENLLRADRETNLKTLNVVLLFLLALFLSGLSASSKVNAAFITPCTAASGCAPDFDGNTSVATFTTNGSGGQLVIAGSAGTISFRYDQVLDKDGNPFTLADDNASGDQNTNFPGLLGFNTVNDAFTLVLDLDGNGDLTGGSIEFGYDTSSGGLPYSFIQETIHSGAGLHILRTASDVALTTSAADGYLTGTIGANAEGGIGLGANDDLIIGFVGGDVTGGILAEYSPVFDALGTINFGSLSGIDATNYLTTSWSGNVASLDIVVPIPAAALLYLSSFTVLGAILRAKRKYEAKV